jgi:Rrf2 family iron-sulfur cluster assembly transcriptional regulator
VRISRESRYAIAALAALATHPPGSLVESRELASEAEVPSAYLSKIMPRLVRGGVVGSIRGRGYRLQRSAEDVSLGDILRAVEGAEVIWDTCIFWREECDTERPCPLHFRWRELKPVVSREMDTLTLAEIRDRVDIPEPLPEATSGR